VKKNITLSISIILLLFSCKKEDLSYLHKYPGLPDATQSGENTMGCLINGVPWVANIENPDFFSGLRNLQADYGEYSKNQSLLDRYYLTIVCKKRAEKNEKYINGYRVLEQFYFGLRPINSKGLFYAGSGDVRTIEYIKSNENEEKKRYVLDTLSPIKLEITKFDTLHNIISGLFDFKLKRISNFSDTLMITNGRFDANYWEY